MPKHYTIEDINGITTIRFSKAPTLNEAKEIIDQLAKDNSYHFRLWDFSNVLFNFSMDEIRSISIYGKLKFSEKNRLAIVAPQNSAFGSLRAFEVYREEKDHSVPRVFRKEQEAQEWLEKQRDLLNSSPDSLADV